MVASVLCMDFGIEKAGWQNCWGNKLSPKIWFVYLSSINIPVTTYS